MPKKKSGRTIIVVTGLPGSGKSEVSGYLKGLGIPMFRTGDVIREEVLDRGLELNPRNSEKIARQLRKEEGTDVAARRTCEKIKPLRGLVCVEGIRDMDELEYLATLGRIVLVIVEADEKVRFSRQRVRRSGGRLEPSSRNPKTLEDFEWRDRMERERGLDEVIATDRYEKHVIENNEGLAELRNRVDALLKEIRE